MANTTAAIMALPTPLDSIRLVGDEEKHATLLFFGETSTLPGEARQTLLDSVAMACKMLSPFGESVIDVVRLGSDVPPALVALLTSNDLSQVRNLFLMNPAVKGYLDNAQQHPLFTPHVTLGRPDFTDEAIIRALMRQIFRVRFDRLSVWWNDERFDCPLWAEGKDAPMSEAVGNFLAKHAVEDEDHLEHHGVKGQKWGVRRKIDAGTGLVTKSDHKVKVNLKTGEQKVKGALFGGEARRLQKHLNDGGQLDLVTGKTGLTPRTGSEDQIHQDRIASKIASGGVHTLSNADIQAYSRRLQLTKDLDRALSEQSAATKAKSDGFIKSFVKKQGSRQIDRVANKAIDVAVEQAIAKSGVKLSGGKLKDFDKSTQSKSAFGDNLQIVAGRLAPKKGK